MIGLTSQHSKVGSLELFQFNSQVPYWEKTVPFEDAPEGFAISERDFATLANSRVVELISPNDQEVTDANEMGSGALVFNNLKECGCNALSRKKNQYREIFEQRVVDAVSVLNTRLKETAPIRITGFATGLLLGELVLLAKIINTITTRALELNFIDYTYESMLPECEESEEAIAWRDDLTAAVPAFAYMVDSMYKLKGLQRGITLRFFTKTGRYLEACKKDNKFKYHLLIGADRGNTDDEVTQLEAIGRGAMSIFLERRNDGPYLVTHVVGGKDGIKYENLETGQTEWVN